MLANLIKKLFENEEQGGELSSPINENAHFILTFENLVIGNLYHSKGKWIFQYSEDFKNQDKIAVLIDFPSKDKKYEESFLWPFFAHRIPGLGQPKVQEIIKHEKLDSTNEIDLLRRFGHKTITNPFRLAVA